jgi:hypothetical protein
VTLRLLVTLRRFAFVKRISPDLPPLTGVSGLTKPKPAEKRRVSSDEQYYISRILELADWAMRQVRERIFERARHRDAA